MISLPILAISLGFTATALILFASFRSGSKKKPLAFDHRHNPSSDHQQLTTLRKSLGEGEVGLIVCNEDHILEFRYLRLDENKTQSEFHIFFEDVIITARQDMTITSILLITTDQSWPIYAETVSCAKGSDLNLTGLSIADNPDSSMVNFYGVGVRYAFKKLAEEILKTNKALKEME